MKVEQIGRRISQKILLGLADLDEPARKRRLEGIEYCGGLDTDVVSAACLAHDLGHPPFGHIGEEQLREMANMDDGFEGNAQTFRIVNELALCLPITKRSPTDREINGLNLSRATLNAILKYPWRAGKGSGKKFGCYESEIDALAFARAEPGKKWSDPNGSETAQSLEAAIMDWADDIAYAVHDVEDFFRAGFIPLDRLRRQWDDFQARLAKIEAETGMRPVEKDWVLPDDLANIVESAHDKWWSETWGRKPTLAAFRSQIGEAFGFEPFDGPYTGTRSDRRSLRDFTSFLTNSYVMATSVNDDGLDVPTEIRIQVALLKAITRLYVIVHPSLATLQHGQKKIIEELFKAFYKSIHTGDGSIFPARVVREAKDIAGINHETYSHVRFVVDVIASMTEAQAISAHHRLYGIDFGSFDDGSLL
jgi:dGTPase